MYSREEILETYVSDTDAARLKKRLYHLDLLKKVKFRQWDRAIDNQKLKREVRQENMSIMTLRENEDRIAELHYWKEIGMITSERATEDREIQ